MMGKAVLQNHMALDVLIASQGGNCAIIQVECGAYIPDESSDVTHLFNDVLHEKSDCCLMIHFLALVIF